MGGLSHAGRPAYDVPAGLNLVQSNRGRSLSRDCRQLAIEHAETSGYTVIRGNWWLKRVPFIFITHEQQALRAALAMARAGVRRHSVLVVMDDPAVALGTVLALHKHYRVGATDTAEGALSLWRAQRHDLVLLDLQLSRAGGEPVLSELLRENPRQPVIVFTEPAATGVYLKLMLTGAVDYLPKPVDTRSLPEICARVLRQQACVASADRSVRQESEMAELFGRVRAAQYTLERGQTRQAARHLRAAVIEAHRPGLSDDEWARLLGEDDNRGGA